MISKEVKESCEQILATIRKGEPYIRLDLWPNIDADTSLEDIKLIHETIWEYTMVFGKKPFTTYSADCVVCHYVHALLDKTCAHCPITWSEKYCFTFPDGEYEQWLKRTPENARALAQKIRDISFKGLDEPLN